MQSRRLAYRPVPFPVKPFRAAISGLGARVGLGGVVVASGDETVSTVSIIVALKHVSLHKLLEFLQKARFRMVFFLGRTSVFKWGDDAAEVHEYLENCRRTPMHDGERTLSEPEIRIWTPSNDMAQSRRRASSDAEVPGCQWDTLKPL